ncbi:toll/interleukin-1 receptor domain-containing protein [Paenibacillus polymyxa]|uniref:toll/interleukin-1 receptor domain-containing protein n=1 Tax=Paenibacillus polymyxa TaxID=1406 RepID=UPI00298C67C8|nr:toll/interleukin-1 receptor domain-containing protein [Paenibacillus polymyxa]
MTNIFLSYSNKDKDLANIFINKLRDFDIKVFVDVLDLKVGDDWSEVLNNGLRNSDAVVILITKNSISSDNVSSELYVSLGYMKERGKPRVLPIIFDDVAIPDPLKHTLVLRADRDNLDLTMYQIKESIARITGELIAKADEKKESIEKVEKSAEQYIQESLKGLRKRERAYKNISYFCYTISCASLVGCIILVLIRGSILLQFDVNTKVIKYIEFSLLNIFIISLIIALARLAFILGKSFMVEALRNADRIHAISFGEFYLKAYGDKADWKEIKEAFQHWNIDNGSSFISQSTKDFDPELIQHLIEFTKAIKNDGR